METARLNASAVLDLDGQYDLEGLWIRHPRLTENVDKFYFLHQLRLKPEIKIVDTLSVHGRFDLLTNPWSKPFGYKGGGFWGQQASSVFSASSLLDVTHLYFSWSNEFMKVMGGRIPLDFGLGLLFDAGDEHFDHFADYLDGIGVQIKTGNFEIYPGYGLRRTGLWGDGDVHEYFLRLQYEIEDMGLLLGLMYDGRIGRSGHEMAYGPLYPQSSLPTDPLLLDRVFQLEGEGSLSNTDMTSEHPPHVGPWSMKVLATYIEKSFSFGKFSLETDFILDSTVGIRKSATDQEALDVSGYAVVAEFASHPSLWGWGLKAGYLSGDDPSTEETYEGFIANRNYDVGMLLFNHSLGQKDVIGGSYRNFSSGQSFASRTLYPDVDYLTNTVFIAPYLKRSIFGKGAITGSLLWARLINASDWNPGMANLGLELDIGFMYEMSQYLTFGIETAWLFPGKALKGEFVGDKNLVYGVQTTVAVSF